MAKQTINQGTPPSGSDGDTVRVGFDKCNSNFTELYAGLGGFIFGLKLEYVSANSLRVTSGSAYIPGLGYPLNVPAAITKEGLLLTASTWYHVYLLLNGGAADIEVVTTAPAAPYSGAARAKTGDTSRRYLGSIRAAAANTITDFQQLGHSIFYRIGSDSATNRILSGGAAGTWTSVSAANVVPVASRELIVQLQNTGTASVRFRPTGGSYTGDERLYGVTAGSSVAVTMPLGAAQDFEYLALAGGVAFADVAGYGLER